MRAVSIANDVSNEYPQNYDTRTLLSLRSLLKNLWITPLRIKASGSFQIAGPFSEYRCLNKRVLATKKLNASYTLRCGEGCHPDVSTQMCVHVSYSTHGFLSLHSARSRACIYRRRCDPFPIPRHNYPGRIPIQDANESRFYGIS